jgi:hypothetical protein
MLSIIQSLLIVFGSVAGALLFMVLLNRFWPAESRRVHNDVIGWHLGMLGTTYAVVLGFMLYAVWINYGAADSNADAEANALVNVYNLANGLPHEQRDLLKSQARSYADAVVNHEWALMMDNKQPEESHTIGQSMWATLMAIKAPTPGEAVAQDHALYELSALTEHRRTRWLESNSRLPNVLWWVLIMGGILTISSSCTFGSTSVRVHGIQVFAFSLLISLVLVAIADIDRPFQGSVHVGTSAFVRAQQVMQN